MLCLPLGSEFPDEGRHEYGGYGGEGEGRRSLMVQDEIGMGTKVSWEAGMMKTC